MMIMNDNTTSVEMAINPLASFAPFVFESILLKGPNEFSNRSISESMYHNETAIAGASMSSTSSEGAGRSSPESIISSIYISAASFILSKASCEEYPQLEQPGSAGTVQYFRPHYR